MMRADLAEVVLVEAAHRRGRRAEPDARRDRRRPLVERDRVAVRRSASPRAGAPRRPCPVQSVARRSSWSRCVSVPPVSTSSPPAISSSASASAFARTWRWYSRNASVAAIRKQVAFAAITCCSGPPCIPGKTARSIACACSSRQRTKPARGPASVLCVVEVTKSQSLTGFGCSPAATSPAKCAMSHQSSAPTSSAIARNSPRLDRARIGGAAADDQLRPVLLREREHLVVVDDARLARDAVVDDRVQPAGEVDLQPVREVAAVVEAQREHRVAGLQARRGTRPCSPARRRAAARSRARRRTAPSPGRSRAARSRRRPRSRRSSACPG